MQSKQKSRQQRVTSLVEALAKRVLVLDGAMGTAIQDRDLSANDFGGADLEGCNENLVLTRPEVIREIHEAYLEAGADVVETNTFGGTPLVLAEYGLQEKAYEINKRAAELAREAAAKFDTDARPRFVAGSIGPTTKAISVTGGVTFDELIENFYQQARGLFDGGCDYFLLETCQDTRNVKAGLLGVHRLMQERGENLPIAVSITIEPMGTMLAGQAVDSLVAALEHEDLLYVGLNCATGPEFMTDHIRTLSRLANTRVSCVPNAGLPDENGKYIDTPDMIARVIKRFGDAGWLNVIGGCCGTTAGHVRKLREIADQMAPRVVPQNHLHQLSGIDYLEINDADRPVVVGERTNSIGSRKFKRLIAEGKFEEAAEIARAQVRQGAQIIDVCLANPDRDELADIRKFLAFVTKMVRVPIMIDSTDERVIEESLTFCQGKSIINSINLEDGEERFEKVVPLAKKFSAALVVGTIDDDKQQGMGVSRQRKLEIAERSFKLLTEKYGVKPEDIYWDPLVFPCATGDQQYIGSAVETVEGIKLIKKRFPNTRTVLGISNVSFGLPPAGREILNSVFLYHCVQAGLDLAIVNAEGMERYASIPENERRLAENVLFHTTDEAVAEFTAHFREAREKKSIKSDLPLEERLGQYIIEGTKEGLIADLDEALKTMKPLDVINGPLMKGMDEVGRLFNSNELIVAEVLQSAEAMKAAVAHLEPKMEKSDSSSRGKMLLATVKGDVHDIGKNLVEIILSNNGFNVINLGIKIPPEQLVAATREHKPDIIGLSGLLVKSAQMMVLTAADLRQAGITTPILVGGAALTEKFTDNKISAEYDGTVAYAKDAMTGLDLAKTLMDPLKFVDFKEALSVRRKQQAEQKEKTEVAVERPRVRSAAVSIPDSVAAPPDFQRHVVKDLPVDRIWQFINPKMLYGKHLGLKGPALKMVEEGNLRTMQAQKATDPDAKRAFEIYSIVEELKSLTRDRILKPRAVYQFFEAASDGNDLFLYDKEEAESLRRAPAESSGKPIPRVRFEFPRQAKVNGLCLSDYVTPLGSKQPDNIAMFVVTARL
jgi:5-methyltetrahydrofolate--homocysteine methyltransferase